ncbi:helix-turn-helix transcriptional regulator [Streptomyces triticirhizae]|uniref:Helix-turn-helix transcriptional regulator n=2 Tax=Streptomyces triticirhizae TaxID=2483353 RepID=A0A3M2KSD9_9ACTN|nr:helix-turn-helix transcriptional regulator [Streptomyces triticirhizae]
MTSPLRMRTADLVGRDAELAALSAVLRGAAEGRGGTVFVTGEPGIGKTRLAARAMDLARDAGMAVLRGRCTTVGPAVPFRPLTEALLALARSGQAPPGEVLGPYLPVLGRLVPEWSTGGDCDDSPVVLAEAVLRLAAARGRHHGSLLVVDDLHDADPETLAVVEYLAANVATQPVALLATVRSTPSAALELVDAVVRRGEAGPLPLGRLGGPEVHALAAGLLDCPPGALPREVSADVLADSHGIPFVAEELVRGMISAGRLARAEDGGWRLVPTERPGVPVTLVRVMAERAARLGPGGAAALSVAAVLGRSFPLSVLRRCAGLPEEALARAVRAAVADGLLQPDEEHGPDWYAFAHPLAEEALASPLSPADRAALSARAAEAVAELYPGLPGTWCLLAARLRRAAGEAEVAAGHYREVARRALAGSGPGTAITVIDEALAMLGDGPYAPVRGGVHRELLETLLLALADDGRFDRAVEVADRLRRADLDAGPEAGGDGGAARRVELHVRLAWAAEVAGRWEEGLAQVAEARALLPADAGEAETAGIDAVEAYLTVSDTRPGRIARSERLARRAIEGARRRADPALACQGWYAVGAAGRGRSLAESDRCFRQTLRIASRHELNGWRAHGLLGLGGNAWLARAATDSLTYAWHEALRTGCVSLAHNAGALLALDAALRSDFARARALVDGALDETRRLKLRSVTRYLLMVRAVGAAHRGRRAELRSALAEFRADGGEQSMEAPLARGLGELFCALLEEDRAAAEEVGGALRAAAEVNGQEFFHLTGRHGLVLLLDVLAGRADRAEWERIAAGQAGRLRFNRQFGRLALAVLEGRAGRPEAAEAAVAEALRDAEPFPVARHLGLRLVAEAALADGWGEPRRWLTEAEEYFHGAGVIAVAGACRSLLRGVGVVVRQRRAGTDRIPEALRAMGLTTREYDVFRLLVDRLGNKALAGRLHLSVRTVEKHVASLLAKTGTGDRNRLCDFAADFLSVTAAREPSPGATAVSPGVVDAS